MPQAAPDQDTPPPHLAIVLPDLGGGGAERSMLMLAAGFDQCGYRVDMVVMRAGGALEGLLPASIRLINLRTPRIRSVPAALRRYLRQARPARVLANMWPLTVAAVLARGPGWGRAGPEVCVIDHAPLSLAYRDRGAGHRLALRLSLLVAYRAAAWRVGVSEGVCADLARLSGLEPARFHAIANPIRAPEAPLVALRRDGRQSESETRTTARAAWNQPEDDSGARILSVGALKPVKNHALLLHACAPLLRAGTATLLILGEGELRPQLAALAETLGVASRVRMPGFVLDPLPYYQSADLFVLTSNHEGFGNVLVEALAAATPVVATDCPTGPREILAHGRFGRLVPPGDDEALRAAILETLRTPPPPELLTRRAADFAPETITRAYEALLRIGSNAAATAYPRP